MQAIINTSDKFTIDWGATGTAEIIQNVMNLIRTFKYEVAYDRTLGLTPDFQDRPLQEAVALTIAQIYELIEQREPRATVEEVSFIDVSNDGDLSFKVVIEL